MKLIKEIEKEEQSVERITEYNEDDTKKSESISYWGGSYSKEEYFYSADKRLIKVVGEEGDSNHNRKKYHKKYEYNGEDYRVLTYITHRRTYDDENTHESIMLGITIWHPVDELAAIDEYKFKDSEMLSETHINLETKETNTINHKALSEPHAIQKNEYIIKNNDNDKDFNKIIEYGESSEVHTYKNNQLQSIQKLQVWNGGKYMAYETKYTYNNEGVLIKTEDFGRGDGKMILYKVIEEYKSQNRLETIIMENQMLKDYLGHYSFESMLEEIKDTEDSTWIKKQYFDNPEFDYSLRTVQYYDAMGNVIHYTSTDAITGQFYDRYVYHYEYNQEKQLEFVVGFRQKYDESLPLEKFYVKKCYYQ